MQLSQISFLTWYLSTAMLKESGVLSITECVSKLMISYHHLSTPLFFAKVNT